MTLAKSCASTRSFRVSKERSSSLRRLRTVDPTDAPREVQAALFQMILVLCVYLPLVLTIVLIPASPSPLLFSPSHRAKHSAHRTSTALTGLTCGKGTLGRGKGRHSAKVPSKAPGCRTTTPSPPPTEGQSPWPVRYASEVR